MSQGKTHRRYDKAFKSQALELAAQPGMTVPKVAADLGIPDNGRLRFPSDYIRSRSNGRPVIAYPTSRS